MNWIPEAASNFAGPIDNVLLWITLISLFFFVLISVFLVYFAVKYRRKSEDDVTPYITGSEKLEIVWTVIPSILLMVIFAYGYIYFKDMRTPPEDATEVNVVAKQWIWQFDYPNGKSTVNELYVEHNKPVKLIMTSSDVLHSFFVPAFRVKQDVVGGIYTTLWFEPTKVGSYDILCAEYCGTGHSAMWGKVIVLSSEDYKNWKQVGPEEEDGKAVAGLSPAQRGEELYNKMGCNACHSVDGSPGIAPTWKGVFGTKETLKTGEQVTVDENYIRESILAPKEKIVKGYQPVMPAYKGQLSDEEVTAIISFIKSLE